MIELHHPVLVDEVIELLDPCRGSTFVDATVGSAGHIAAIQDYVSSHCPSAKFTLIGIDRDSGALQRAKQRLQGVQLIQGNFAGVPKLLVQAHVTKIDGLLADLGFSSEQIEDPEQGFSFRETGPLDMRYDQSQELTAAEIVNHWPEAKLRDVIEQYSGERYADRIARAIVRRRPLYTTTQLAEIIAQAVPKQGRIHPATRTFQALRIAVNQEFEALEELLSSLPTLANPGARIVIITFHSLEERIVRHTFKKWAKQKYGEILTKKPVVPSGQEIRRNPRSRSAHLWVFKFEARSTESETNSNDRNSNL